MKTKIKQIFIILISILFIVNIPLYSEASDASQGLSFDDIMQGADDFLSLRDDNATVNLDESELQGISQTVSNILLAIAIGVTVISAVVMGINFTIQSVEDKAKVKESMIPWIIGIFVAFGAYGIWRITMEVFYNLT